MSSLVSRLAIVAAVLAALTAVATLATDARAVAPGDAEVWYLGHAGWAVKTRGYFLVFDYWGGAPRPDDGHGLASGRIDPREIGDRSVVVFVSHAHGDHWDPAVLDWDDDLDDVTYVFGFAVEGADGPDRVFLTDGRVHRSIAGLEVSTVDHRFDLIPEVAWRVEADGLTIFHSGDHGTVSDPPNPLFVDNIDHIAAGDGPVDLAFVSIFGMRGGGKVNPGDRYTIERLRPRYLFPMHRGGAESAYAEFAEAVEGEAGDTVIVAASAPGDHFVYSDGALERPQPGVARGAVRFPELDWLVGQWQGYGEFEDRWTLIRKSWAYEMSGMYLVERTIDMFPPDEPSTEFEIHEDFTVVYRGEGDRLRARGFFVEGFVTEAEVQTSEGGARVVIEMTGVENGPAGMRARYSISRTGPDSFEATFEIAPPGADYTVDETIQMERAVRD